MIGREFAKHQIYRLTVFESFPRFDEGISELISTLEHSATSQAHAIATLDALIAQPARRGDGVPICPAPDDVIRIAHGLMTDSTEEKPIKCTTCGGTGWIHSTRMVINSVRVGPGREEMRPVPYHFEQACHCRPKSPSVVREEKKSAKRVGPPVQTNLLPEANRWPD